MRAFCGWHRANPARAVIAAALVFMALCLCYRQGCCASDDTPAPGVPVIINFHNPPPIIENEDYPALMDAIQVKVKTRGVRGAGTAADVFLSICDLTMNLGKGRVETLDSGEEQFFTLIFAQPGPGDVVAFPSYPYGWLKFCDIKIWHDTRGGEPGWYADYIRIYYHLKAAGWMTTDPYNGWYKYASPVHFFDERDHWTAEYRAPYAASEAEYLQYYGTGSGGNRWLALAYGTCPGCDLSYSDLHGADFTGGDFTKANFTGANLSGVNFTKAKLSGAVLEKSNLSGAALPGLDLTGTNMRGARLHETMLGGAILDNAHLRGVDAWKCDLKKASMRNVDMKNASIEGCDLSGAILADAVMTSPESEGYGQASLRNSLLQGADARRANLRECNLAGVDFNGANLDGAFVARNLKGMGIQSDAKTTCPNGKPGPCLW